MTNPKHTDTSRSGDLVERLRKRREVEIIGGYERIEWEDEDALEAADRIEALTAENERLRATVGDRMEFYLDRIEALNAEVERLRKLTCATWFYMPDEGDRCWFSPHEVIDEMYDPKPGDHVFEVECATSLPSIWCAVRVTDDPDADERFTFTEHATEAEARAALGEKQ